MNYNELAVQKIFLAVEVELSRILIPIMYADVTKKFDRLNNYNYQL